MTAILRAFILFFTVLKGLNFAFSLASLMNRHSRYKWHRTLQKQDSKPVFTFTLNVFDH